MVDRDTRDRIPCEKHINVLLMWCPLKYLQEKGDSFRIIELHAVHETPLK